MQRTKQMLPWTRAMSWKLITHVDLPTMTRVAGIFFLIALFSGNKSEDRGDLIARKNEFFKKIFYCDFFKSYSFPFVSHFSIRNSKNKWENEKRRLCDFFLFLFEIFSVLFVLLINFDFDGKIEKTEQQSFFFFISLFSLFSFFSCLLFRFSFISPFFFSFSFPSFVSSLPFPFFFSFLFSLLLLSFYLNNWILIFVMMINPFLNKMKFVCSSCLNWKGILKKKSEKMKNNKKENRTRRKGRTQKKKKERKETDE